MASGAQTSNEMDEMRRPLQLTAHWPLLVPALRLSQGAEKHASRVPGSIHTDSEDQESLPLTAFRFLLSWHPHEVFADGTTDNQESPAHCFVFPPFLASVSHMMYLLAD